ncbi:MAG TPA: uracil-DNA glycosylase [Thermoanaerobaculia bacterium]|nr:uracil-DNA glycosylase [Thermoanaerobaculia bacterium]
MTDLARELELLREFGYTHLDIPSVAVGAAPAAEPRGTAAPSLLDELRAVVTACEKCRLAKTRTQVVYGVGNPNADLMFIGEAPGRDEDLQGEPFVGRAGQLLTDIIKAMKLTRDDVYIANVIKCRPPENRNPEPDELDACRPYIRRQVELIQPKVIVTLGRFALQSLTERGYAISSARGQWLEYNGVKVMPTYHPAYLLRNPAAKKEVWADMKKVMTELGIDATPR